VNSTYHKHKQDSQHDGVLCNILAIIRKIEPAKKLAHKNIPLPLRPAGTQLCPTADDLENGTKVAEAGFMTRTGTKLAAGFAALEDVFSE
jgi:hypothetical protein